MAQVTTGIRGILSPSLAYEFFRDMLGGRRAFRHFVDAYIRPFPGMRILDLGCGPASLLDHLPESVAYLGVDINEKYVVSARQKYGSRASFQCSAMEDAATEALRDFDLVLGMGFLHHLDQEPAERFFALAARAVKPSAVRGFRPRSRAMSRRATGCWPGTRQESTVRQRPPGFRALARTAFPVVEHSIRHDLLRLPYTHIIMECRQPEQGGR